MQTYARQTLLFGEDELTSLQAVSPASRSRSRASAKARRTSATCGRKCCGLFGLFDLDGSWARMFSELLIGRKEWSSTRCALTWRRQDMRFNRTLYRLAVSVLPTEGTDAGSSCVGRREVYDKVQSRQPEGTWVDGNGSKWNASDADGGRLSIAGATWRRHPGFKDGRIIPNWDDFPTQSPVRCRNDGVSGGLDGITFPKWRNMSIKAYGNAIVPQVALQIFKTINEYENHAKKY